MKQQLPHWGEMHQVLQVHQIVLFSLSLDERPTCNQHQRGECEGKQSACNLGNEHSRLRIVPTDNSGLKVSFLLSGKSGN